MKLPLSRIAEFLTASGDFDPKAIAEGYSIDSRTVRPGELFFAVKGERLDGHDFIDQALAGGAVAAVVRSDQLARYATRTQLLGVEDTLVALQRLATAVRRMWARPLIAVTGSVNQHGEIQAVGGVTPKIEGFFAVCKAKGLTGEQGIMIPAANVPNLMLDEEIIDAVRAGQFHVWAVSTIDEGIELLTGHPAGQRDLDGQYPAGTVHQLVEKRLQDYAERLRAFSTDHRTEADRSHSAAGPSTG